MSEEPRRSGRATKGQHGKSSSPAPNPLKPAKTTITKGKKKQVEADDNEEEDVIRCICGNDDPDDKRAFIGCEACLVWQHNVCMGEAEDESDVPEHYFCEECRPEEHGETLAAVAEGEPIWEVRSKKWQAWKKMSSSRRKGKGKGADDARPPWLKNDVNSGDEEEVNGGSAEPKEETGNKRKRESVKPEPEVATTIEETTKPAPRPDKRRKSSQAPGKATMNPDTAVVDIDKLPNDRKKGAQALSKVILEDLQDRMKSGFRVPDGYSPKSLGDRYASLIEYALFMNHGSVKSPDYGLQFRALLANLKRNKLLIERLLEGSLAADELAVMESAAMASEEKQLEWKKIKEANDRQTVVVEQEEGPRYRSSHKGLERIEDERMEEAGGDVQPVRERASLAEEGGAGSPEGGAGSPTTANHGPLGSGDARRASAAQGIGRRASSQFDMNNIWQKTSSAQSPTSATGPRPLQMPPRRRSSVAQPHNPQQPDGAKDDPDVDRLLQDDDDTYSPSGYTSDATIVWSGRLVHAGEGEPLLNARFVAGRDLQSTTSPTASWRSILPAQLAVDGRLAVQKAEEYLCGLQWSANSDVSVLALTAVDDMDAFNRVFEYFLSRGRYAVVNGDKPAMVRDLYVIPVEKGAGLPEHISMLEYCVLKAPAEERMMLATFVVASGVGVPVVEGGVLGDGAGVGVQLQQQSQQGSVGGEGDGGQLPQVQQQQHLPQHMRAGAPGPAGSPLHASAPAFSPAQSTNTQPPIIGYGTTGAPHQQQQQAGGIPPSPYEQQATKLPQQSTGYPSTAPAPSAVAGSNPLVSEVLGPRQWDPTAVQIVAAEPDMPEAKLRNLRAILEEDVVARTDLEALARRLGAVR